MIFILACRCANAEEKARRVLRDAGVADWLSIPCYIGRPACTEILQNLPVPLEGGEQILMLRQLIDNDNSWSVVVGANETLVRWATVKKKEPDQIAFAKAICEAFADNYHV